MILVMFLDVNLFGDGINAKRAADGWELEAAHSERTSSTAQTRLTFPSESAEERQPSFLIDDAFVYTYRRKVC